MKTFAVFFITLFFASCQHHYHLDKYFITNCDISLVTNVNYDSNGCIVVDFYDSTKEANAVGILLNFERQFYSSDSSSKGFFANPELKGVNGTGTEFKKFSCKTSKNNGEDIGHLFKGQRDKHLLSQSSPIFNRNKGFIETEEGCVWSEFYVSIDTLISSINNNSEIDNKMMGFAGYYTFWLKREDVDSLDSIIIDIETTDFKKNIVLRL